MAAKLLEDKEVEQLCQKLTVAQITAEETHSPTTSSDHGAGFGDQTAAGNNHLLATFLAEGLGFPPDLYVRLSRNQRHILKELKAGQPLADRQIRELYSGVNWLTGCDPKLGLYNYCGIKGGSCVYAWLFKEGLLTVSDYRRVLETDLARGFASTKKITTALYSWVGSMRGRVRRGFARDCGLGCRAGTRAVARLAAGAPLRARGSVTADDVFSNLHPAVVFVLKLVLLRNLDILSLNPAADAEGGNEVTLGASGAPGDEVVEDEQSKHVVWLDEELDDFGSLALEEMDVEDLQDMFSLV